MFVIWVSGPSQSRNKAMLTRQQKESIEGVCPNEVCWHVSPMFYKVIKPIKYNSEYKILVILSKEYYIS